jgi:hypothetical protein
MNQKIARKFLALLALVTLAACAETRYVAYDGGKEAASPFARTIEFDLTGKFYKDPPECAVILPFTVDGKPYRHARVIEDSLARHLSAKMNRVIGPLERRRLVRAMAVDLSHPADRAAFARTNRCRAFVEAKPWGGDDVYVLFWTQSRIGLDVTMTAIDGKTALWRARHVATRSDGGLPLSPFSAAYNMFNAARFTSDGDVAFSLVDDAVRRIAKTLPDTRYPVSGPRRQQVTAAN